MVVEHDAYFDGLLISVLTEASIWVVGLIVAACNWRRHPSAALLVAAACVMALAGILGQAIATWYTFRAAHTDPSLYGTAEKATLLNAFAVCRLVLHILAIGMLLCAVFHGRKSVNTTSQPLGVSP